MLSNKFILGGIVLVIAILASHKFILTNSASIGSGSSDDYSDGSDIEDYLSGNESGGESGYEEDDESGSGELELSGDEEANETSTLTTMATTTTVTTTKNNNNDDSDGLSSTEIALIVVGLVVVGMIVIGVIVCLRG